MSDQAMCQIGRLQEVHRKSSVPTEAIDVVETTTHSVDLPRIIEARRDFLEETEAGEEDTTRRGARKGQGRETGMHLMV